MTTYSNADLDDMFDGGKAATVNVLNDIAAATERIATSLEANPDSRAAQNVRSYGPAIAHAMRCAAQARPTDSPIHQVDSAEFEQLIADTLEHLK
jgi:hypothetical protein